MNSVTSSTQVQIYMQILVHVTWVILHVLKNHSQQSMLYSSYKYVLQISDSLRLMSYILYNQKQLLACLNFAAPSALLLGAFGWGAMTSIKTTPVSVTSTLNVLPLIQGRTFSLDTRWSTVLMPLWLGWIVHRAQTAWMMPPFPSSSTIDGMPIKH
jgi:hypothetical protein